jgi:glycolate oxidase FAD binding subunit
VIRRWLGSDTDAIGARRPQWVIAPTTLAETVDVVAETAAKSRSMVVRGLGTRQDQAAPPRTLDAIVDLSGLSGIVEYEPGDLVMRVHAGTPLPVVQEAAAQHGQQLAIDSAGTVGGLIATNTSGPRRLRYGTCRDLLIGVTAVLSDATVARSGGKVVKNVAGYDLGKLYTGSFGTLGVITEAVFRLHPRPGGQVWVTTIAHSPRLATDTAMAVRTSTLSVSALEVDWPLSDGPLTVTALVEDADAAGAANRAERVAALMKDATVATQPPVWWGKSPWAVNGTGIKVALPLSRQPAMLESLIGKRYTATVRGSLGAGVLQVGLPGYTAPTAALAHLREIVAGDGSATVVRMPEHWEVDRWGAVPGLDLMRRIKDQFDPAGLLAPGRFVGGI